MHRPLGALNNRNMISTPTVKWRQAFAFSFGGWRASALALIPAALLLRSIFPHPLLAFAAAALALIPLASLLGDATEQLSGHAGAAAGGLLNATLGNITELVFGLIGLAEGHTEVVKASLTGSIIGNLLLVFGLAAFLGGLRHSTMRFSQAAVGTNTSMLFLAVVGLVMPALYQLSVPGAGDPGLRVVNHLSMWTAIVLLASYLCSFIFIFRTHRSLFRGPTAEPPRLSPTAAVVIMVVATALIALASEVLISQIQAVTLSLGCTELFVGIVIVAAVGNAAEHSTAILLARKNEMDLALGISIGSSAQIALLIAPLLVVVSHFLHMPMSLVFNPLEIAAVIISVVVVTVASADGETHWFEGAQLLGIYALMAVFFYYVPAG